MSHPVPGFDGTEQHNRETNSEYAKRSKAGAKHKALHKHKQKAFKRITNRFSMVDHTTDPEYQRKMRKIDSEA